MKYLIIVLSLFFVSCSESNFKATKFKQNDCIKLNFEDFKVKGRTLKSSVYKILSIHEYSYTVFNYTDNAQILIMIDDENNYIKVLCPIYN